MNQVAETGFIHGRFQIFHNEHLRYALAAKELCQELIVGITSPDPSVSPYEEIDPHRSDRLSNPCSYYERMKMVKLALIEANLDTISFSVVPLPIGKADLIRYYVPNDAVSFFTIYDEWGREKLKRVSALGYRTHVLWDDSVKGISVTQIRMAMLKGEEWEKHVPQSVAQYIIEKQINLRIVQAASQP